MTDFWIYIEKKRKKVKKRFYIRKVNFYWSNI